MPESDPSGARLTPAGVRTVCARLVDEAGGYLRNVVREAGLTCSVCAGPVRKSYPECRRCQKDRAEFGDRLADLVVPICYAVKREQSGYLMWMYKHPTTPVRRYRTLLTMLLLTTLSVHERCVESALGRAVDAWAVVPSTSGRSGEHPLRGVARAARFPYPEIGLVHGRSEGGERATLIDRFTVDEPDVARGGHVLLIDDTWATGAHSQSAAMALKQAGADAVTVMVMARWLNPYEHEPTAMLVRGKLTSDYDPQVCPVSGERC